MEYYTYVKRNKLGINILTGLNLKKRLNKKVNDKSVFSKPFMQI